MPEKELQQSYSLLQQLNSAWYKNHPDFTPKGERLPHFALIETCFCYLCVDPDPLVADEHFITEVIYLIWDDSTIPIYNALKISDADWSIQEM